MIRKLTVFLSFLWGIKIIVHLCCIHSLFPSVPNVDSSTNNSEAILCYGPHNENLTSYMNCIGDINNEKDCELIHLNALKNSSALQMTRDCLLDIESPYKRFVIVLLDGVRFDALARFKSGYRSAPYQSVMHGLHALEDDPKVFTASGVLIASTPTTTTSMLPSMMRGIYRSSSELLSFISGSQEGTSTNILQSLSKYGNSDVRLLGDASWIECFGEDLFTSDSYSDHYFDINKWDAADKVLIDEAPSKLTDQIYDARRKVEIMHSLSIDSMSHASKDLRDKRMMQAYNLSNEIVKMVAACAGVKDVELCPIPTEINDDTLLLFAADHGMTVTGGHGHGSNDEVQGLFLFASRREFKINIPTIKSLNNIGIESEQYGNINELENEYLSLHHVDLAPTIAKLMDVPSTIEAAGRPGLSLTDARVLEDLKDSAWRHLYGIFMMEEKLPMDMIKALRNVYAAPRSSSDNVDEDYIQLLIEAEARYRNHLLTQSQAVFYPGIVLSLITMVILSCLLNFKITHDKVIITYACIKGITELLGWFDMVIVWCYRVVSYICVSGMVLSLFIEDSSGKDKLTNKWDFSPLIGFIVIACLSRAASLIDPQHNEAFDHPSVPSPLIVPELLNYLGMIFVLWRCNLSYNQLGRKNDIMMSLLIAGLFYLRRVIEESYYITFNCIFAISILCLAVIIKDCALRYVIFIWFLLGPDSANRPLIVPLILFVMARNYLRCRLVSGQQTGGVRYFEIFGVVAVMNILWYHSGNRENFEIPFYSLNTFVLFQSTWGKGIASLSVITRIGIPIILGYSLFFDLLSKNCPEVIKNIHDHNHNPNHSKEIIQHDSNSNYLHTFKIGYEYIFKGIRLLFAVDGILCLCSMIIVIGRIRTIQFDSLWGPRFITLSAYSAALPITVYLGGGLSIYGSKLFRIDGKSSNDDNQLEWTQKLGVKGFNKMR